VRPTTSIRSCCRVYLRLVQKNRAVALVYRPCIRLCSGSPVARQRACGVQRLVIRFGGVSSEKFPVVVRVQRTRFLSYGLVSQTQVLCAEPGKKGNSNPKGYPHMGEHYHHPASMDDECE
jgi:hypothetical protein